LFTKIRSFFISLIIAGTATADIITLCSIFEKYISSQPQHMIRQLDFVEEFFMNINNEKTSGSQFTSIST
jgi:ATP-dependent protease HslVU (ClpYQ) peptidase subunit